MGRRLGFVGLLAAVLAGACGSSTSQPRDGGAAAAGAAGTTAAAGRTGTGGGAAGRAGTAGTGGGAAGSAGAAGTGGVAGSAGPTDAGADTSDPGILTLPDGSSAIVDASSVDAGAAVWVNRTPDPVPPSVPSRRVDGALAYDPGRHKIVLFGGSGGDGFTTELGDTLEWDPSSGAWTTVPTMGVPPAQGFASLLFDDRLNQVLEVGESSVYFWILGWDGTSWTEPNSLARSTPTPRQYPAVTFDSGRGKVVVFGGGTPTALLDELWEWDPTSGWVNRTPTPRPAAWPTPRASAHALAYDSARAKCVLFSGAGVADLWEWDGATGTWTDRTPGRLPAAWPPLLFDHALVYDAARSRTVVLGGTEGGHVLESVWEWDGAAGAWTEHAPPSARQSWPLPLYGVAAAYDSDRHRVVLVGGAIGDVSTYTRQTWEWDGDTATFTDRTIAAAWPREREAGAITFDTRRGKAILMGGGLGNETLRDLWEWDDATGTWADRTPDVLPPSWPGPGANVAMADDPDRGRILVASPYTERSLYAWDPSTGAFTDLTPSPLPASWPPVGYGPMAYDAKRKRIVMVAGYAGVRPNPGVRGRVDTWELDPATLVWRTATTDDAPPARILHTIAYDSRRGSVVLFGGEAPSIDTRFSDLWEWDGGAARWIDRTPSPLPALWPSPRSNHALAYSAARGRIVLFGGVGATADTWEWDGVTGRWQVYPAVAPSISGPPVWPAARVNHALTSDPARGTVMMFSGREPPGSGVVYHDLWDWGTP